MEKRILKLGLLAIMLITLNSCELVGDIFEAGVSVGIFLVVIAIILIIWLISRFRK